MYTGRITDIGTVVDIDDIQITLTAPVLAPRIEPGGSINVSGVCLSAVDIRGDTVIADATPETRRRTRLDEFVAGTRVNLEAPLAAGEPLDGHLVQGHVDAVGKVVRIDEEGGGSRRLWIRPPSRVLDAIVAKGSVGVDGVSLTVAEVVRDRFSVALIPVTLAETTLVELGQDDRVHLETDVLAKLVSEQRGRELTSLRRLANGLGWAGSREGQRGVEQAVAHLAMGGGVVVWDPVREGEGDVVFAGEKLSPEAMTFLLSEARGHTTVPCAAEVLERLAVPPLAGRGDRHGTSYHNSLDAVETGTGVSAHDRATTIRRLADPDARPEDFFQPGHVFPLAGRPGGLAERAGHTEAALDLCARAGLAPVAAICEVMGDDGHILDRAGLERWSLVHEVPMIAVGDLLRFPGC